MDKIQFMEAVQNMRSLQKEYFRNRDRLILQRCKASEKAIDDYLCMELYGVDNYDKPELDTQQKLF